MKDYVILRDLGARPGLAADAGGFQTKELVPRTTGLRETAPPDVKVEVERLSGKDAGEAARDPAVRALAPVMPTALIEPLDAGAAAGNEDAWGIAAVGADKSAFTGAGVTVAVLDTGIDAAHPAFEGVEIVARDFSGTGDGDREGHGTHCAGTIFGRDVGGNRIGLARGVARALIGKVLKDDGSGDSNMIFEGMQWALGEKADIISMSIGFDFPGMVAGLVGDGWPPELATSVALEAYRGNLRLFDSLMDLIQAYGALGSQALVVAAAGNESRRGVDPPFRIAASLPAAADDVVSVAAVGMEGTEFTIGDFSNSMAVLAAPGVDIPSAKAGGGLKTMSGTSMACPHVAGVAALWWEKLRSDGIKPGAVRVTAELLAHARPKGFAAGYDEADFGRGLISAP